MSDPIIPATPPEPQAWDFRHAILAATIAFNGFVITYSMIWQTNVELAKSIAADASINGAAIACAYLFGAPIAALVAKR